MKRILILFDKDDKKGLSQKLKEGFEEVYKHFNQKGIELCRAPISSYDSKNNCFKKAYFFSNQWQTKTNVHADLVYDKTPYYIGRSLMERRELIEKNNKFINNLKLSETLSNKWLTYLVFRKFSPQTSLIDNANKFGLIRKIRGDYIILKPLTGSGGKGIKIIKKSAFKSAKVPFIAQELIDNQSGIKNITAGPHDLRIFIFNETPFYCYLRLPRAGNLLANIGQGGRAQVVDINALPGSVDEVIRYVSNKLKQHPVKFYSLDLAFDQDQKPWILELNSRPGIIPEKEEGARNKKHFFNYLYNHFNNTLN